MHRLLCTAFTVLFLQVNASLGQNFYDLPIKDIAGNTIELKNYLGKKIMFLIVPLSSNDSLLMQLDSFLVQYEGKIQVIGMLSKEEGYTEAQKISVVELYRNRNLLLTEGMKTRKGPEQAPLMQWLTDRRKNNHFDMDAQGIGHKFFVSETGRLFAVMPRRVSLTNPMMRRIINSGRTGN